MLFCIICVQHFKYYFFNINNKYYDKIKHMSTVDMRLLVIYRNPDTATTQLYIRNICKIYKSARK